MPGIWFGSIARPVKLRGRQQSRQDSSRDDAEHEQAFQQHCAARPAKNGSPRLATAGFMRKPARALRPQL